MKTLKTIINIMLGIGFFAVFNESGNFWPNIFGLACFAALIIINGDFKTEQQA